MVLLTGEAWTMFKAFLTKTANAIKVESEVRRMYQQALGLGEFVQYLQPGAWLWVLDTFLACDHGSASFNWVVAWQKEMSDNCVVH